MSLFAARATWHSLPSHPSSNASTARLSEDESTGIPIAYLHLPPLTSSCSGSCFSIYLVVLVFFSGMEPVPGLCAACIRGLFNQTLMGWQMGHPWCGPRAHVVTHSSLSCIVAPQPPDPCNSH
eukprot:EG_transcript_26150